MYRFWGIVGVFRDSRSLRFSCSFGSRGWGVLGFRGLRVRRDWCLSDTYVHRSFREVCDKRASRKPRYYILMWRLEELD